MKQFLKFQLQRLKIDWFIYEKLIFVCTQEYEKTSALKSLSKDNILRHLPGWSLRQLFNLYIATYLLSWRQKLVYTLNLIQTKKNIKFKPRIPKPIIKNNLFAR